MEFLDVVVEMRVGVVVGDTVQVRIVVHFEWRYRTGGDVNWLFILGKEVSSRNSFLSKQQSCVLYKI